MYVYNFFDKRNHTLLSTDKNSSKIEKQKDTGTFNRYRNFTKIMKNGKEIHKVDERSDKENYPTPLQFFPNSFNG